MSYQKRLRVFDEIADMSNTSLTDFYKTVIKKEVPYTKLKEKEKKRLDNISNISERAQAFLYNICFESHFPYDLLSELKKANSKRGHVSGLARILKRNKGTIFPHLKELWDHNLIEKDSLSGGGRYTIYMPCGITDEDGFDSLWDRLAVIAASEFSRNSE